MAANNENSATGSSAGSDSGDNGETSLRTLMLNISKDLNASINGLNRRIVQVEQNLEKNLVEKLTSVIHLTVKEEISKARSDFDSEICAMKLKLSDMENVLQDHNGTINAGDTAQKPCSVIIRNLRESPNEAEGSNPIAKNKVISLVRDGLKLRDVRVSDAERKKANGDNPGLIVATFESHEQVAAVLKAKTDLRKTNDYSSVYIEPFLSQAELSTQTTFRTILREIGKSDNYLVHGSKLIPRRRRSTSSGRRHGENRGQSRDRSAGRSGDTSAGRPTHFGRSQSHDRSNRGVDNRRRQGANRDSYQGQSQSHRNDNRNDNRREQRGRSDR